MNLKHFYYRTYFEGIDLHQPVESEARKAIERVNEPKLKASNHLLCNATPVLPQVRASGFVLPPGNVAPLVLEVQNPGLLPGIGYPHEVGYAGEFKLGFHFDHTSGLPVLPGTTVKGVLRSLWPQYGYKETAPGTYRPDQKVEKSALQAKKAGFILKMLQKAQILPPAPMASPEAVQALVHRVELAVFEGWDNNTIDGKEPKYLSGSQRAVFFDAFPVRLSKANDGRLLGRDALTPHGDNPLKNPIPLPFMKVLPGVHFAFSFRLPTLHIQAGFSITPAQLRTLFELLLEKTGAGAKTNVGYGQFGQPVMEDQRNQPAQPPLGGEGGGIRRPETPPKIQTKSADKWRAGEFIVATVVERKGMDINFKSEQVSESEWLLKAERVALIDRFVPGREIEKLAVIRVDAKNKVILVRVTEYPRKDE